MPVGSFSCAAVASPLSPEYPGLLLVPATVVMMPLVFTLRTTAKLVSEK